eukprot:TRINITY_DN870_c2_g1_i1.p1 TRINITY_DN870_c2_g1~~TRINITY_DN870_c2_g1_i1.p1  ORF type:complete len:170 (+),score=16.87 TRINITY_DN870_c2_g1_i1:37-546(+)
MLKSQVLNTAVGPFSCNTSNSLLWTVEQENWCCQRGGIRCKYDCTDTNKENWSVSKWEYCCKEVSIACLQQDGSVSEADFSQPGEEVELPFILIAVLALPLCVIVALGRHRASRKEKGVQDAPPPKHSSNRPESIQPCITPMSVSIIISDSSNASSSSTDSNMVAIFQP